jgi:hypothetical protein
MVSTLIVQPANGATLSSDQDIVVEIDIQNMDLGFFSDSGIQYLQYYTSGQQLNGQGIIQGHQHITVQNLNGGNAALDANGPAFFKEVNDELNGGNTLSATIPAGELGSGEFRICSITGTFTHQPVLMPVAQRGSQDDCIRITIE